jgi:hypothetical protein
MRSGYFAIRPKRNFAFPARAGTEHSLLPSLLIGSIWQWSDELDAIVLTGLLDLWPFDRVEGRQPARARREGNRAVELPVARCREDQVAGLFRLDSEAVNGSTW